MDKGSEMRNIFRRVNLKCYLGEDSYLNVSGEMPRLNVL